MVNRILVVGGGSAGFLAAITLKQRLPHLRVDVLRSKDIGIIGVGEGTSFAVPRHLHGYMKIDQGEFYREVDPIWKLGISYIWGPRPVFEYVFGPCLDTRYVALPKETGYYCQEEMGDCSINSALMARNKVFIRQPDGTPRVDPHYAYHLENEKFVHYLERLAAQRGVGIADGTVVEVRQDERGVKDLLLASGETVDADLYVDASGFRSLLLGQSFAEPFVDFKSTLYCDRAVVGGWDRGPDEPIQPYTTAETMDAGWAWRIDHTVRINRGYVYSSSFISDDQAEREFREKNPKVGPTRVVKFRTGAYRRAWVKNVVAIGNSNGFVEPLEATAIAHICVMSQNLAEMLAESDLQPRPTVAGLFNRRNELGWEHIRRFLAIHYRFNRRLDTPFWRECCEKCDLGSAAPIVEYYQENGPNTLWRNVLLENFDQFGPDGYLAMFVGQKVPFHSTYNPSPVEQQTWDRIRRTIAAKADQGLTVQEALAVIRSPGWTWRNEVYN